jgi:hypothetical protein
MFAAYPPKLTFLSIYKKILWWFKMKIYLLLSVFLISAALVAAAMPDPTTIDSVPSKGKSTVTIPAHAVEVIPGVFRLGAAVVDGQVVEGYAFVHYKEKPVKPATTCGNGICELGENVNKCPEDCGGTSEPDSTCYGFLARDAMWKTVEPYVINTANTEGIDSAFVASNFAVDVQKWEDAAGVNIIGTGSTTTQSLVADTVSPDGVNEVYFGSIDESNAIAITIVWGVFGGPPKNRVLIEWDQIYDQVDYDWSSSGEYGKMDFENIATHELGHSVGMGDLYTTDCSEQTMYGYASYGETKKSSLESGDIAGIRELYS